ncbi:MAG: hypothetical protein KBT13_09985 [Bacteroidales bacterium]|nr:hypothetical protein [Candidatus Sodaliphilus limicaballi]
MTTNLRNMVMSLALAGSLVMASPVSAQMRNNRERGNGGSRQESVTRERPARQESVTRERPARQESVTRERPARQESVTRETNRDVTRTRTDFNTRPTDRGHDNSTVRPNDRGNNRDNRGSNLDNRGNNRDNYGNRDNHNRDNRGNNRDNYGNRDNHNRDNHNRDNRGNNRDNYGNRNNHDNYSSHYRDDRNRGHNAYRDHYSWNHAHNDWSRPLPPPARMYRPAPYRYHRPHIPVGYRPYYGAPVIDRILGITFGATFNVSLNYLYTNGYIIDGYDNNVVYLRDVNMLNLPWADVMLCYDEYGRLTNAQFIHSSYYNDRSRYNRIYHDLCAVYGTPIEIDNRGVTWFGGNNTGYVTLEISCTGSRYYTNLFIGN